MCVFGFLKNYNNLTYLNNKMSNLNLNFLLSGFIISGLFTFSFVLFYLDNWKFSINKIIKCIQIISFVFAFFLTILFTYYYILLEDFWFLAKNNNNIDYYTRSDFTFYKEIHDISKQNKKLNIYENQTDLYVKMRDLQNSMASENFRAASSVNSTSKIWIVLTNSFISPLQKLLSNEQTMNYACLTLSYIFSVQLILKTCFKDKLNYINYLFGIILFIGIIFNLYGLYTIYIDIESFIKVHNLYNSSFINDYMPIINGSNKLRISIFNLITINLISILDIIFLMWLITLKFNYNKSINNVHMVFLLLILMLTLSLSAYIFGSLLSYITNYVDISTI
jgi:hypothetical protein